jgi:hypothetical protein
MRELIKMIPPNTLVLNIFILALFTEKIKAISYGSDKKCGIQNYD